MSIAEKLIKIAENEPKVYEAGKVSEIQGIAPAEVDASLFSGKLKTIAENTVKVYEAGRAAASRQKATASGEVVRVDDVSPIAHDLKVSLKSKNRLIYPYANSNKTANGITYTDNGDGSIKVNGTATGTAHYYLATSNYNLNDILEDGKTYIMSEKNSISGISMLLQYKEIATGNNLYQYTNKPFTIDKSIYQYEEIRYQIKVGTTVDNLVLYPQIEEGNTATSYTPYISDFSGSEVSRYGRNLALAEDVCKDFTDATLVTFENRNAIRFLDNKRVQWQGISFKENTQYTVSFDARITLREPDVHRESSLMYFFYSDGTSSKVLSFRNETWERFTLTSTAGKTLIAIGMDTHDYTNHIYIDCDSFQLEVGAIVTDYEPYTEPQTAISSADGMVEGLTSISPTMTLIPDTSGVTVTAEYYKDK